MRASWLAGLVDGEIGGEIAQAATNLGSGNADFLLGGGDDARALFAERGLDALLVFEALLLDLGAKLFHLLAEARQLGLDSAQAGLGVGGRLARGLEIRRSESRSACG